MQELEYDKVFEVEFSGVTYLLHLSVNGTGLTIDLQDKNTGEVWLGSYSAEKIQQNTQKTGNFKKYPIFVKMLILAINRSNEAVELDLLTYQDLQHLRTRKNISKSSATANNTRRYLMLNYVVEFDKVHYPIQLNYEETPCADRLKLTIRRLRSELDIYRKGSSAEDMVKDLGFYKQENQLLKTRIKRLEEGGLGQSQLKREDRIGERLQADYQHLKQVLSQTEEELRISRRDLEDKNRENSQLKGQLTEILRDLAQVEESHAKQSSTKRAYHQLSSRVNELTKQTTQLASELTFSRQQEKKAKLRIGQLQKQLQSLLKRPSNHNAVSTGALKRPGTPTSQKKSESKYQPRKNSVRKRSVVDSDTQSSRMRKMTNRHVSPFRNSKVMQSPAHNRSRSKSKQRLTTNNKAKSKKSMSPRSNILTDSEQNIDPNFASDSDSETNKISATMAMLRKKREQALKVKEPKTKKPADCSNMQTDIEKKIGHIAEILRKSRKQ